MSPDSKLLRQTYRLTIRLCPKKAAPDPRKPLSLPVIHILLALADGARHGYAIKQDVEERTGGAIRLGPGTLYEAIQRLLDGGLIEEASGRGAGKRPAGAAPLLRPDRRGVGSTAGRDPPARRHRRAGARRHPKLRKGLA